MKRYSYIYITLFLAIFALTSCNYLDIVPDETAKEEDAFKDKPAAKRFMYSCYSYIPRAREGTASLDIFSGDDVVTCFEHEPIGNFPKGNYTANNPVISYWNTLFGGIKQCYILKNNIDKVPGLPAEDKADYLAQADFLIAYYHYLLLRCYGPVILVKEEPSITTMPVDYLGRSPYDECVTWIAKLFDDAASRLPASRVDNPASIGLATSTAAKAIKARMYLYAASPLFNGNSKFYADFKNPDGTPLFNTTYDANKWVIAKNANKEAIDAAEKAGYRLYSAVDAAAVANAPEPADPVQRTLRFNLIDRASKENIWADQREEGAYDIQKKSAPYWGAQGTWNGVCLTLTELDRFYTEKGLPIDQDPDFNYKGRFDVTTFEKGNINGEGETSYMNTHREPRYYAWVSFHGGYYEILGGPSTDGGQKAYRQEFKRGVNNSKIVTWYKKNDNCGIWRTDGNDFSVAGNLNKKGVSPRTNITASGTKLDQYPWPFIRLTEVYLNYAEACVETNDLEQAKVYLNKVRERAGVPTVETAWGGIGVALTQDKLREIVRQERLIEFYLENQNFWDMRRWLIADKTFNEVPEGLNCNGATMIEFSKRTKCDVISSKIQRKFVSPRNYLLPIPYGEMQRNIHLVQNPGY